MPNCKASWIAAMLLTIALTLGAHGQEATNYSSLVHAPDRHVSDEWFAAHFAGNSTPPFSFDYDGKPSAGLLAAWTRHRTTTKMDSQRTRTEYVYTEPATKLIVRCVAVRYSDFPAVEWTVYFQNKGTANTPILANIQALDLNLSHVNAGDYMLHYSTGSHAGPDDYQPQETTLPPGKDLSLGGASGWSTTEVLSYFNLMGPDTNLLIGIGWPGNWKARFTRDTANGLHILTGQGLTHFVLHPGEEARSPLVSLQFYTGDWIRGQNLWRRWMLADNMPRTGGKLPAPTLQTASQDIGNLRYNEANELRDMDGLIKKRHLIADHWVIDAGWYPDGGNWPNVGTWTEDKAQFPDGIRAVSDHARSLGLKQVLWFETERVTPGTDMDLHHANWLITLPDNGNRLFNMGNPAARQFMTDLVSSEITNYGVDIYRQDFNFDPLAYWLSQDALDRQGLTENHYVEGFLAYWDALRARHPNLVIDCCASGGRRNDLEVLRRAVPLWQSDCGGPSNATQAINYGAALWMPYHGDASGDYGPNMTYEFRSGMAPCHGYVPNPADDKIDYDLLNKLAQEEMQVKPYYFGDYYPLMNWNVENNSWMGWQYDRPDLNSGIVQAFRRSDNGEPSRTFHLAGLDAKALYRIHDFDTNLDTMHTGTELMEKGLAMTLPDKPQSALLMYQKVTQK